MTREMGADAPSPNPTQPMCVLPVSFIDHPKWGGSRSTVVACWTAGQVVKRLILHLGHGPSKFISLSQGLCECGEGGGGFQLWDNDKSSRLTKMSNRSCTWGMIHTKIHTISPSCPWPSKTMYSAELRPKTLFISSFHTKTTSEIYLPNVHQTQYASPMSFWSGHSPNVASRANKHDGDACKWGCFDAKIHGLDLKEWKSDGMFAQLIACFSSFDPSVINRNLSWQYR